MTEETNELERLLLLRKKRRTASERLDMDVIIAFRNWLDQSAGTVKGVVEGLIVMLDHDEIAAGTKANAVSVVTDLYMAAEAWLERNDQEDVKPKQATAEDDGPCPIHDLTMALEAEEVSDDPATVTAIEQLGDSIKLWLEEQALTRREMEAAA